jgi:leucyl-tRNA synthetase
MPVAASKEDCERAALAEPSVVPHVEGQTIRKVVVVPGKIVNIVV